MGELDGFIEKLEALGEEEVRRKLILDVFSQRRREAAERWLAERQREKASQADNSANLAATNEIAKATRVKQLNAHINRNSAIYRAIGFVIMLILSVIALFL